MIIVSQDRTKIGKFTYAWIDVREYLKLEGGRDFEFVISTDWGDVGYYATENRAREVLNEMVDAIHHCNDIYKMPEE